MSIWVWIVNSILWAISLFIAVFGIRFILKGIQDLKKAEWSEYADKYEDLLKSSKENETGYDEIIKGYEGMIAEAKELLKDRNFIPENLAESLSDRSEGYSKKIVDLMESKVANLEAQGDIVRKLTELAEKGGITGFSALSQIKATKNIAMTAVFLAISSAGFSISSVIISIAK